VHPEWLAAAGFAWGDGDPQEDASAPVSSHSFPHMHAHPHTSTHTHRHALDGMGDEGRILKGLRQQMSSLLSSLSRGAC